MSHSLSISISISISISLWVLTQVRSGQGTRIFEEIQLGAWVASRLVWIFKLLVYKFIGWH